MKEYKIIEIDGDEAGAIATGCESGERLALALASASPMLPARFRQTYRDSLSQIAARLQIAERYLRDLEIKAILAKEVREDEN